MKNIFSFIIAWNWTSFAPDLIVSFISLLIPLVSQYFIAIKPLKDKNNTLQKKLDEYSTDIIDIHLEQLNKEAERLTLRLKTMEDDFERFLAAKPKRFNEIEYIEFVGYKTTYEEDIDKLTEDIMNIQLRKLNFIKENRKIFSS